MVEISVIIPCYNVQEYLEECLDSVINQTFRDIEIICINDGSTDNTLNILEKYAKDDDRIRIINQDNSGLSVSRNVGLDAANGKYICFIDSDDYFDLNAFREIYDLSEEKSLDFLIFKLINFDDDTRKTSQANYFEMKFLKDRVGDKVFSLDDVSDFLLKMNVTAPGKLFRHEFIKGMKFPEGLMWEDNPFFLEAMIKAERVYFYDKHLYFRRIRESSMVHSQTDKYSDGLIIFKIMEGILKDYDLYERFKVELFIRKLYSTFMRFSTSNPEDKEDFFKKLKEDYSNQREEAESEGFLDDALERYSVIFYSALDCENPMEFELTVKNHDLRTQNAVLRRQIRNYEELNEGILNSNSWKLTGPFRKIFNKF